MSVSDNFNLRSRVAGVAVGLLSLTAAFLNVSQGNGMQGLGQYLMHSYALFCAVGGGGLLAISLSGLRDTRQSAAVPAQTYSTFAPPSYKAAVQASREEQLRSQRHGRLTDGGAALVFSVMASQMPAGSGGELLALALAGYGAGSMMGATWNTAQLKWLKRKPSAEL